MNTRYFDERAKAWDDDPVKIDRAQALANELRSYLHPGISMHAYEFGCGTGLLGYFLRNSFGSITLADSSEEMIKVLKEKIRMEQIENLHPLITDLQTDGIKPEAYDVLFTFMTLHHITDLETVVFKFYKMIKHSGYVCIADLVTEDGTFHENMENFDGHNGFERNFIEKLLKQTGFKIKLYKIFFKLTKTLNNGISREYPLFLLIAQK